MKSNANENDAVPRCPEHGIKLLDGECMSCKYSNTPMSMVGMSIIGSSTAPAGVVDMPRPTDALVELCMSRSAARKESKRRTQQEVDTDQANAKTRRTVIAESIVARRAQYAAKDAERVKVQQETRARNKVVNRWLLVYCLATAAVIAGIVRRDVQERKREADAAAVTKPSTNYRAQCDVTFVYSAEDSKKYFAWLGYDPCKRRELRMYALKEAAEEAAKAQARAELAVVRAPREPEPVQSATPVPDWER